LFKNFSGTKNGIEKRRQSNDQYAINENNGTLPIIGLALQFKSVWTQHIQVSGKNSNDDPVFGSHFICYEHLLFFGRHQHSHGIYDAAYMLSDLTFSTIFRVNKIRYYMELHTPDICR